MNSKLVRAAAIACVLGLAGCATSGALQSQASKTAAAKPRTAEQIMMNELIDNPSAHAILKKHAPTVADHPQLSMARGMTLADVAGYAEAGMTAQTVQAIVDDVNKL